MNRLDAMKRAIMSGATSISTMSMPVAQPVATPSAAQEIARLRAMLAHESRMRQAAEARLRGVMQEIARRTAQVRAQPAQTPRVQPSAAIPVAQPARPQADVIDLSDVRAAIQRVGGDEPEHEEEAI